MPALGSNCIIKSWANCYAACYGDISKVCIKKGKQQSTEHYLIWHIMKVGHITAEAEQ